MKPIHECAVIKDGNKRVAYMITESNTISGALDSHWKIVDAFTFENLVVNNKVQQLVWENNTIKCKYDLEEIRALKKIAPTKYMQVAQENYWNMDVQFKYKHIQAADKKQGFAICLAGIQKILGMYTVSMIIYGDTRLMSIMVHDLELNLGRSLEKVFKHNGDTIGQLMIPIIYLDNLLDRIAKIYRLLFSTSTLKFMLKNNVNARKIPLIEGKADPEKVLQIINRLDKLTLDNEQELGI